MAKAVGPLCNMHCSYCYYIEKDRHGNGIAMDDSTLENFIRSYIKAQNGGPAHFIWHGGEPFMAGLDFYRKAVELQREHAAGTAVFNCIQTNGTLIDDEWCRFLKDNGWLVGLSVDGPEHIHDACRRYPSGEGSFADVMKGIEMLNAYNIEWNAMAVVNSMNAGCPDDFYNFFKSIGCRYLQFTPVVERVSGNGRLTPPDRCGSLTPWSVTPQAWGDFLCRIFDIWVRRDVGQMFVQLFDATLANWLGEYPGLCTMSAVCGHAGALEKNGDLYCCDHFVFPEYRLGNINRESITKLMSSSVLADFAAMKTAGLSEKCRHCDFLFACHGECPKNRFVASPSGYDNYLCDGYRKYFSHVAPYMNFMANEFRANRSPANIMKLFPKQATPK